MLRHLLLAVVLGSLLIGCAVYGYDDYGRRYGGYPAYTYDDRYDYRDGYRYFYGREGYRYHDGYRHRDYEEFPSPRRHYYDQWPPRPDSRYFDNRYWEFHGSHPRDLHHHREHEFRHGNSLNIWLHRDDPRRDPQHIQREIQLQQQFQNQQQLQNQRQFQNRRQLEIQRQQWHNRHDRYIGR